MNLDQGMDKILVVNKTNQSGLCKYLFFSVVNIENYEYSQVFRKYILCFVQTFEVFKQFRYLFLNIYILNVENYKTSYNNLIQSAQNLFGVNFNLNVL